MWEDSRINILMRKGWMMMNKCSPLSLVGFLEWLGTSGGSYSVLFCLCLGGEERLVFLVHFELLIFGSPFILI